MRKIWIWCMLFCLLSTAQAQNNDTLYIKDNYTKREVYIPMRDGTRLFTAIYEPKDKGTLYPILMIRTPYSVAPYGEENFRATLGPSKEYIREGFVFVYQDVRGKYMSEGDFIANRPLSKDKKSDESTDTYDTIDWLVKHIRSNKKVGIWGVSAPGMYASFSLINSHPNLLAVSPQAPVTDWFLGDDRHHNGAFMLMGTFSFLSSFGRTRDSISTRHPGGFGSYNTSDSYGFYLKTGALKNFNEKYLDGKSILWNEMMYNPDYNDYWEDRNYIKHIQQVKPQVLVTGGWFDQEDLYGPLKTYAQLAKYNKDNLHLVMGPWYHGSWTRFDGDSLASVSFGSKTAIHYRQQIELPFFKKYLKGEVSAQQDPVQVFYTGGNYWKSYEQWPIPTQKPTSLYMHADGSLSFQKSKLDKSHVSYDADPAKPVPYTNEKTVMRGFKYMIEDQSFPTKRPDVLVFESDILEDDITIAGNIVANLFISSTGTDADFVVKLIDVHPYDSKSTMSDYHMLVRGEVMRAKYRNSFSKPEPLVPNEVHAVSFDMQDAAHVFKKGHRIQVQIQSSWFPLVDRNPQKFIDIYKAEDTDFSRQTQTIHLSKAYPSNILLPIVYEK